MGLRSGSHASLLLPPARARCRDRIGEKDDKDAARTYHEGPPSDPAEKDAQVLWREWPGSSGARMSSKWFAPRLLGRPASSVRAPWSWTASPASARAG